MRFALLMTADYAQWREMSPNQSQALESQVRTFNNELSAAGVLITTEGLDEAARHVHFHAGHTRTSRTARLPRSQSDLPPSGSSMWPIRMRRLAGLDGHP